MANNSVQYRFGTMKYLFIMLAGIAGIVSGCSEKKTFTDTESALILSGRVALEGMPETPDAKADRYGRNLCRRRMWEYMS